MFVNEIIENVEHNSDAFIYIDNEVEEDIRGWYIPENKAIGISANQPDDEAIKAIIHEVAHHVDISENNHEHRRDIDGEIIAHACEEIIYYNAPVNGVIGEVEEDIREAYMFNGVVSVDEEDINEVAERVRIIIGGV